MATTGRSGQVNIWAALQSYFGAKTGRDISNITRRIVNNVSLQYGLATDISDVSAIKVDSNNITQLENANGTQVLALSTLQLSTPTAPTLTYVGTAGSTTYTYVLVASDGTGATLGTSPASASSSITTGASSLTAANNITIKIADTLSTPTIGIGNITYKVYRTVGGATQGLIGTITPVMTGESVSGTALVDNGLAGDSSSAPTLNTTGTAVFNGPVTFNSTMTGPTTGAITYSAVGTATLAQINAGTTLITGVAGRAITPVNFWMQMNGTFTTSTDIRLSDTTPTTDIVTIPIASAVTGANFGPSGGGFVNNATTAHAFTVGAGMGAALGAGLGVQIRQTGTAAAGGTSILWAISYTLA